MKNNLCTIFIFAFYIFLPLMLWYIFKPYFTENDKEKEFMQNVKKVSQEVWNDKKI